MDVIESLYAVELCDFPGLPEKARFAAEARYVRVLERQLGGAEAAVDALRTVLKLTESDDGDIGAEDIEMARRWSKAVLAAREAGYQGLGEAEEAYFDVRLV
jgi:hypothetical protein